ncbi:MAG: hypothetical protein LUG12_12175 [Erysipelotrichaceae bacterium]|nr:hypothetical protein [Erysipelotrichaceae bacterium]
MNITIDHIEQYLVEVKESIQNDQYIIARNDKRQDNLDLFINYIIDETMVKDILLKLTPLDFSEVLPNEHVGFEHEMLYVFGKDVLLLKRVGDSKKKVHLYIKMNKLENHLVLVVSLHEQKYPLKYYYKEKNKYGKRKKRRVLH